jgi:hypothetical protein
MIVRPASDFDYAYVCRHLRDINAEETFAVRGHIDRARLAREFNAFASIAAFRTALCEDASPPAAGTLAPQAECTAISGRAIAVMAAYRAGGDLAAVHLIATDAWPLIALAAYRFMHKVVVREWFPAHGIRRAQTDVLVRGPGDRAWLHALGFADDGPPAALGLHGEMFQRVTWRAVDAAPVGLASAPLQQGQTAHV